MLTDGEAWDKDDVIKTTKKLPKNVKIHTFGIGNGCDEKMVKQIAEIGRGSCNIV